MNKFIPHQISLAEAIGLTSRYRQEPVTGLFLSEAYDAASVLALLQQPACKSFRLYLGRKEDGSICTVLVAADADGKDILPPAPQAAMSDDDEGILLENAFHCPPICPPPSPLNG
ncbi:MAG: hypothetical protein V4450_00725 [Bacteroidota bacterium]